MSNLCDNCINPDCMRCPVMAREVYSELGYYENDNEEE